MNHVNNAIKYNQRKRNLTLEGALEEKLNGDEVHRACATAVSALTTGSLSTARRSLRLCLQFYAAQLRSLCLPVNESFLMWLTLQNDGYFLSGRDASQRLSAGEYHERNDAWGM